MCVSVVVVVAVVGVSVVVTVVCVSVVVVVVGSAVSGHNSAGVFHVVVSMWSVVSGCAGVRASSSPLVVAHASLYVELKSVWADLYLEKDTK